jgi:hypothetical protein
MQDCDVCGLLTDHNCTVEGSLAVLCLCTGISTTALLRQALSTFKLNISIKQNSLFRPALPVFKQQYLHSRHVRTVHTYHQACIAPAASRQLDSLNERRRHFTSLRVANITHCVCSSCRNASYNTAYALPTFNSCRCCDCMLLLSSTTVTAPQLTQRRHSNSNLLASEEGQRTVKPLAACLPKCLTKRKCLHSKHIQLHTWL